MRILDEDLSDLSLTPCLHDLLLAGGIRKLSDLSPLNLSSFIRLFKGRLRSCGELQALLKRNHLGFQFHVEKETEIVTCELNEKIKDLTTKLQYSNLEIIKLKSKYSVLREEFDHLCESLCG
jgi:hypothetical protein